MLYPSVEGILFALEGVLSLFPELCAAILRVLELCAFFLFLEALELLADNDVIDLSGRTKFGDSPAPFNCSIVGGGTSLGGREIVAGLGEGDGAG